MRFLSFHCEHFGYKTTKRSRSKVFEELTEENKEQVIENALLLLISIEKQDETSSFVIDKSIKEIEKITNQLKVSNIVLLSFAHLFGELSSPEFGLESLKTLSIKLETRGFKVIRSPFGWFNELDIKAKGHPLSRISRIID
ncbi:MAG: threonyl-tRNA synthetase editing domain-containing protein [Candidatus Hermodarchaeota archaeon]